MLSRFLPGKMAILTGFGYTRNYTKKNFLHQIELPIAHLSDCREAYKRDKPHQIPENMNCIGTVDHYGGACQADSGAPLAIDGKLVGLISVIRNLCGTTKDPAYFIDVAYFRYWIDQQVKMPL